jgi:hypothetical protein
MEKLLEYCHCHLRLAFLVMDMRYHHRHLIHHYLLQQ